MDVVVGNPGMDRKLEQNIEFRCRILIETEEISQPPKRVLGGANREWM